MAFTASQRAALAQMTDEQLREIIRFNRMNETAHLAQRGAIRREAQEAEDILHDRQAQKARHEFRRVRCVLPADPAAHPMSGRVGKY